MKTLNKLTALITFVMLPLLGYAQTMDMSELKELEKGNYSFVKGKVQVTLADTTSPDFITKEFERLGYGISNLDIMPVIGFARTPNLPDSVLRDLRNHPHINEVIAHKPTFGDAERARILQNEDIPESRKQAMIEELEAMSRQTELRLYFEPFVTVEMAENLDRNFESFSLDLEENLPRSVIINTEEGKELDAMDALDKLPYVQYTALIGVIGDK